VLEEVKEFLAPELINRLSAQIVFKPLTKELMSAILKKELDIFLGHWKVKIGLKLPKFTPKKLSEVVEKIYDAQYGARPIYRYIHDEVEPALIEQIIDQEMKN
jgi:ATP-dependent Clp protease ATP-binding subunit ClpA